jgi:hypothetical protein
VSSVLAQRRVRVATMKSGERFILESYFGNRALLHGEVEGFVGQQSAHVGKPVWVDAASIVGVEEMPKTPKLMMALISQAAKRLKGTVQVQKKGARLIWEQTKFEPTLTKLLTEMVTPKLSREARASVMGWCMARD